jgi:hypothetical protein
MNWVCILWQWLDTIRVKRLYFGNECSKQVSLAHQNFYQHIPTLKPELTS